MDLSELKKVVYDANLALVKRNLVICTWGNVSAIDRERGLVVIKPRGIPYEKLVSEDMSVVDMEGRMVGKGLLPSVDLDIHLELYRRFPSIGGIAHTHSTYATAWSQACRPIPVMGTTHADHFYGSIPCTRLLTEEEVASEYERNQGKVICETMQDRNPVSMGGILTAGHGPFTWGKNADEAVEHAVILEELAKMAWLTLNITGGAAPVIPHYMVEKHYTRKYGPNSYFYQEKK